MKTAHRIPAAEARRLAVEAHVDPRTLARVAAGLYVRGDAGTRARVALIAAGYLPEVPRVAGTVLTAEAAISDHAGKEAARR